VKFPGKFFFDFLENHAIDFFQTKKLCYLEWVVYVFLGLGRPKYRFLDLAHWVNIFFCKVVKKKKNDHNFLIPYARNLENEPNDR